MTLSEDGAGMSERQKVAIILAIMGWVGFVGQTVIASYWWLRALRLEKHQNCGITCGVLGCDCYCHYGQNEANRERQRD